MSKKRQVTIVDVAKAAGVSMGTVDRVVHNRGEVSAESSKKVLEAIQQLDYKPNLHAAMLSIKRKCLIVVVIPNYQIGDYWECVHQGVQQVSNEYLNQNVVIETVYFNQFDKSSFDLACTTTEAKNPNAVLIAPIFRDSAVGFFNSLNNKDIPVVYIDTYLENTNYLAYYGIPQFESGYLLGHLLFKGAPDLSYKVVNFTFGGDRAHSNLSVQNRLKGLQSYIQDHGIECVIDHLAVEHNNMVGNFRLLDGYFADNPDVDNLIVLNSRVYMIAEWLEIRGVVGKSLYGFDALQRNVDCMKSGFVDTIIAENLSLSIRDALMATIRFLLFRQMPATKNNYSTMNILNRYNVDFYK